MTGLDLSNSTLCMFARNNCTITPGSDSINMSESSRTAVSGLNLTNSAYTTAYIIWTHVPPPFWVLGTAGNILIIVVFSRKGMSNSLTAFLFKALVIFDTMSTGISGICI